MTMNTVEFLNHLNNLDIKLTLDGERLKISAPKNGLDATLRTQLTARKAELIEFLSQSQRIPTVSHAEPLPLSFAQERLWLIGQLTTNQATYNILMAYHWQGLVNVSILERSLNQLIQRHEILRTTFVLQEEKPQQIIHPNLEFALTVVDLTAMPPHEQEAEVQRLAIAESLNPFNLIQLPLFRCVLLQLDEQNHVFLLNIHHIISDGWSHPIFLRDLFIFYEAALNQHAAILPEMPIQYADYAVWLRQELEGETLEKSLAYWRKQLQGAPPLLELPTDYPRPPMQQYQGDTYFCTLPAPLVMQLKSFSQQAGATLYMTLLTAFEVLLYRYSGQTDMVVGSFVANRHRAELDDLIGFFVNTIVLRTDLSNDPTFSELLKRVRAVTLEAYTHQELPFEKLVEALQPERNLSYSPFVQVAFVLQNVPSFDQSHVGIDVSTVLVPNKTTKFDMTVYLTEEKNGEITIAVEYDVALFKGETIARWLSHYQTLLEHSQTHLESPISQLPLMSEVEMAHLLVTLNNTQMNYAPDKYVHHYFVEQAARIPDTVAVIAPEHQAKPQLTYRELDERSNQLAHYLQALGVGPNVFVGISLERIPDMLVSLLGILKAGGTYIPLDPAFPRERLAFMVEDAQIGLILTQERLLNIVPSNADKSTRLICLDRDWSTVAPYPITPVTATIAPDNLAYILYTSGSTGKPKGVQISHRALVNFLLSMKQEPSITSADRLLAVTTLSFDISMLEVYLPLLTGAQIILASQKVTTDGTQLVKWLHDYNITFMQATPATWRMMLETDWQPTPDLKILCGGEAMATDLAERLLPKAAALWNVYGPTETTIWSTAYHVTRLPQSSTISIGRPIANTQIYILDKYLQPVPIGVVGDLYIGGDGVANGYLNRPELTAEKFIANPFIPGGQVYLTGDLARYHANGNIEFLGRIDHQVKIRGFRIELGDIEAALNEHDQVKEAVVIAREDTPGDKRLVAYLVLHELPAPSVSEWRSFLQQKLPPYMVPAAFVVLEALPLTPNGKVDRKVLPKPESNETETKTNFVAPRNPLEAQLCQIWERVLKVQPVGVKDNFFELGGHSLLAVQLVVQVEKAIGQELLLATLFQAPTIEQLAEFLHQQSPDTAHVSAIPLVSRDQRLPLSFAQERLWFISQLTSNQATYNLLTAYHWQGSLNLAALESSLNQLIQRHEMLRTMFVLRAGQPQQLIQLHFEMKLPLIDLTAMPPQAQEAEVQRLAIAESLKPFDLTKLPLFSCVVLKLSQQSHVFVLTIHHIISDGWSQTVFIQELLTLYEATLNQRPATLSVLPIQYADYSVWQRQELQGEALDNSLAYWHKQLQGVPPVLELPTDYPRPPVQQYQGDTYFHTLPAPLVMQLKQFSQQTGATLYMTLLTAFKVLLYRYSGQTDLVIGSFVANRHRAELDNLIGFFVNTIVLRTDLSADPPFLELLNQVRTITLEAYTHQELPFARLIEALQPERNLSYSPLIQVAFVLQNVPSFTNPSAGVEISSLLVPGKAANFDLTLYLTEETNGDITIAAEYDVALFKEETIIRWMSHYQTLLEHSLTESQQRISRLTLMPPKDAAQLLVTWNQTQADYPLDSYIVNDYFIAQAAQTPDAIAVFAPEDKVNPYLTYQELDERSNQLGHYLQSLGVGPNKFVGICMERTPDMLVSLFGILKAGGTYIPLDPAFPLERLTFMVEDAQIGLILTQERLLNIVPTNADKSTQLICLDRDWPNIATYSINLPILPSSNHGLNLAYILYTSGSTGKPKGVQISHRALINFLLSMQEAPGITSTDRLLAVTTLSFDISMLELYLPLITGAQIILASQKVTTDGTQLVKWLHDYNITFMQATPATWRMMLETDWQPTPNLKILCGGEAMATDLAERLLPKAAALWNVYGPTETTIWSTAYQVTHLPQSSTISIGRPIANTQIYILNKYLQPVPIGVVGDLYIGGDGVANGYLNRPELTTEKFTANPFIAGGRVYLTGDLARYLPDGNIEFLGRIDHQVKIRGFRIELGDIEAALNEHVQVKEAVVIAREDTPGDKRLVAYLVLHALPAPSVSEWRSFLQEKLPPYMVPAAFVVLEALPLTPNGKVDRKVLPAPTATGSDGKAKAKIIAPRDDVEQKMAKIWESVLKLNEVSIRDNFFELGGHSLLAVRLFTEIERVFGRNLPLATLFQAPTIEDLANLLRNEEWKPSWSSLVALQPKGSKIPLFCAHAIGGNVLSLHDLARHLGADQPFYALQSQGLDGKQTLPKQLEEMAAYYLEEIRTVQPHGPYYLIGQSSGGVVAFEMAQQLVAQGEEVALLALIDTHEPSAISAAPNSDARMKFHLKNIYKFHVYYVADRLKNNVFNNIQEKVELYSVRIAQRVYETVGRPIPHIFRYIQVEEAIRKAIRIYEPKVYPGRMVLFRATETFIAFVENQEKRQRGWAKLAGQGMDVYDIPGAHNLEQEPHVGDLAGKLVKLLA